MTSRAFDGYFSFIITTSVRPVGILFYLWTFFFFFVDDLVCGWLKFMITVVGVPFGLLLLPLQIVFFFFLLLLLPSR